MFSDCGVINRSGCRAILLADKAKYLTELLGDAAGQAEQPGEVTASSPAASSPAATASVGEQSGEGAAPAAEQLGEVTAAAPAGEQPGEDTADAAAADAPACCDTMAVPMQRVSGGGQPLRRGYWSIRYGNQQARCAASCPAWGLQVFYRLCYNLLHVSHLEWACMGGH